jgi:hypothetical protein
MLMFLSCIRTLVLVYPGLVCRFIVLSRLPRLRIAVSVKHRQYKDNIRFIDVADNVWESLHRSLPDAAKYDGSSFWMVLDAIEDGA